MEEIEDFSDDRNKTWCIHCTRMLATVETNFDHVPTKGVLDLPIPENEPKVPICKSCNSSFSADEEYFIALLGCVLSGSVIPEEQTNQKVANILRSNYKLRQQIKKARTECKTTGGDTQVLWKPDQGRIDRVILKNARGHAFFELGEPMLEPPASVWSAPLSLMNESQRKKLENFEVDEFWPEVGSRMMTRVVAGLDLAGPWVVVQPQVYRYAVAQAPMRVRTVIREYLATEVCWDD
ncbi:MAG: hypothetical protein K8F62_14210 [Pseudorhodoplanes sp.]|nr:hypothetical protein [Pseudorhodoplanes sp.]